MYKFSLNGETDAVLKRAAAAAFDVKVEDVIQSFSQRRSARFLKVGAELMLS